MSEHYIDKANIQARISKEIQFDAGHRVPRHVSKCRHPHGHRYRVVVHCRGTIIDDPRAVDDGMLIDFGQLKVMMEQLIHDPLDHGFIVHSKDVAMLAALETLKAVEGDLKIVVFPYVPTAENVARWCWEQLVDAVDGYFRGNLKLDKVEVWETPTACAYFDGGL